jgi:hypothetical protein
LAEFYHVDFTSAKDEVERIGEQDDEIIEEEREEVLFLHKAEVENQRGRQRKLYCGTRSFEVFARAQRGYSAEDGGNGTNALHFREGEIIRNVQRIDTQTWEGSIGSRSGQFPASYVCEISAKDALQWLEKSGRAIVNSKKCDETLLRGLQQQNASTPSQVLPMRTSDLDFVVGIQPRSLKGQAMVVTGIYSEEVGKRVGVECWAISNFQPVPAHEVLQSGLLSGEAYVILHTQQAVDTLGAADQNKLQWTVYYWLGQESSADKRACVAIHAVNLKGYLGGGKIVRLVQGDEPPEFLKLFPQTVQEGSLYASSLREPEETCASLRVYLLESDRGGSIEAVLVDEYDPPFHPTCVLLFDQGPLKHLWYGRETAFSQRSKARLYVDQINKNDHLGKATVKEILQGSEDVAFWQCIECLPPEKDADLKPRLDLKALQGRIIFYTLEINLPVTWETVRHSGKRYFLHRQSNGEIKKYDRLPLLTRQEFQGGFFQLHQESIGLNKLSRYWLKEECVRTS